MGVVECYTVHLLGVRSFYDFIPRVLENKGYLVTVIRFNEKKESEKFPRIKIPRGNFNNLFEVVTFLEGIGVEEEILKPLKESMEYDSCKSSPEEQMR